MDDTCTCYTCAGHTRADGSTSGGFSRAYLHHLIRSGELLGLTLLSLHNLTQLIRFTRAMAQAIADGCFSERFAPWEPDSPAAHTW